MIISNRLVAYVGGNEGFVSKWYLDPVQVPTIGFGFTWGSKVFRDWWMAKYNRKFRRGDTISKADALEVLKLMLGAEYSPAVEQTMPGATINVKEASTSLAMNAGTGSLKWKWAQAFARGDVKNGADLMRRAATTAKGKSLPGLVRRRKEEGDIAEFNRWPSWLQVPVGTVDPVPVTHIGEEEIRTAQTILKKLGYYKGEPDGIPGPRTDLATRQFQKDHGTLVVDGIIGKATLTALIRTQDVADKAKKTTAGGVVAAGGGGLENATGAANQVPVPAVPGETMGWLGDVLLYGGLAFIVIGLVWLAWRYRDEIPAIIRRLA